MGEGQGRAPQVRQALTWSVVISRKALKEMASLPKPVVARITEAIDDLREEPRPAGVKKLKGREEYLWRIRIGNYRVVYSIEDKIRVVEVRDVGHRSSIYR